MSSNQIEELPHELGKLNKLKILDVTSNQLTVVPPDLGSIETLEKVDLSLNPVVKEVDEFARKGPTKLKEYLKSDDYDQVYYRERKKKGSA